MSIIDFSEIENITADENKLEELKKQMQEQGLLTEKGNPSNAQISTLCKQTSSRLLFKLNRRMPKRFGGIESIYKTFKMLEQRKEYTAMYFYLTFLYGFIGWRMPRKIEVLSSNVDALKVFFNEFLSRFEAFLSESEPVDSGEEK